MKALSSDHRSNPIWRFLSSIHLAVFLLITLAVTSIIGTVIPQGQSLRFYLEHYGPNFFLVLKALHLNDTYHSWWYTTLLGLFSVNLVVCTLRRLPFTLKLYKKDNLTLGPERLLKMPFKKSWKIKGDLDNISQTIISAFKEAAGKVREAPDVDGGRLFLAERGKWSYWGIYALHSSVLIIFMGALVGLFLGFKGSVMLSAGKTIDSIVNRETGNSIPLGFSVRCDHFHVSFYDNGEPKEYRSDLTVLNGGKEVLHKSIVVNNPLKYKGITFYQASYQAVPEATLRIVSPDGRQTSLDIPAFQRVLWPEAQLTFGLMRCEPENIHGRPAVRIWVENRSGRAKAFWLLEGSEREFDLGRNSYRISLADITERYLTGLQVKKDPGVSIVWLGFAILLFGFGVVFWVPHQRIWLWIGRKDGKDLVILSGQTNKNRLRFEKNIKKVEEVLDSSIGVQK
ncbi:MAG: hypothetical protein GWP10_02060 [Nitrospiraceae bacterium]|nr:hypothetical protein [Nitrospiraceae bacterium]